VSNLNGGRLILPRPENGVCRLCGDSYPVLPGDKSSTCSDWVESTIKRLPQPMNFDTLLNLKMFAKLCNISRYILRGLETLDEVEGRG
jgi:hypothetical protein